MLNRLRDPSWSEVEVKLGVMFLPFSIPSGLYKLVYGLSPGYAVCVLNI